MDVARCIFGLPEAFSYSGPKFEGVNSSDTRTLRRCSEILRNFYFCELKKDDKVFYRGRGNSMFPGSRLPVEETRICCSIFAFFFTASNNVAY